MRRKEITMKNVSILTILFTLIAGFTIAAEVNVFNARHYKADAELYNLSLIHI